LPQQWKESKNADKTDCNNYRKISLSSTAYKLLSNILLTRLTPNFNKIVAYYQCGFRCNRFSIDQIFYIRQILEKKWECNGTEHQQSTYLKTAYDSFKREVLYNILLEFGIPKKLVRLLNMCLNET
jgi:hypothetical protein